MVVLWNTNDEFRANVIAAWEAVKTFIGDALVKIKETVTQAWEAIKRLCRILSTRLRAL